MQNSTLESACLEAVIGLSCPVFFFAFGRDLSLALIGEEVNAPTQAELDGEEEGQENKTCNMYAACHIATNISQAHKSLCSVSDEWIGLIVSLIIISVLFLYFILLKDNLFLLYGSLFDPLGAIIRMKLCDHWNSKSVSSTFKIGTFLCNALACVIIGVSLLITNGKHSPKSFIAGGVGSFSTVSSWVNDSFTLRTSVNFSRSKAIRHAYVYYFGTVGVCLLIVGSFLLATSYIYK